MQPRPATASPQAQADRITEWALAHPLEMDWLAENMESNDFARSLAQDLEKWGRLTDGQLGAVTRNVQRAGSKAAPAVIDVAEIERRFAAARENLVKKPMMRLDTFVFKAAGAESKNAGGIYVTEKQDDGEGLYLGKVMGGQFLRSRDCTDDQQARILIAAADPAAAAKAYGQRTGNCSVCGRELTAEESIERFIGPICIQKYGL